MRQQNGLKAIYIHTYKHAYAHICTHIYTYINSAHVPNYTRAPAQVRTLSCMRARTHSLIPLDLTHIWHVCACTKEMGRQGRKEERRKTVTLVCGRYMYNQKDPQTDRKTRWQNNLHRDRQADWHTLYMQAEMKIEHPGILVDDRVIRQTLRREDYTRICTRVL